jgi:hypothetical protein
MLVLFGFIAMDTFCGLWLAFSCRRAASKLMITKLVSKTVQYATLLTLSAGGGLLAGTWIIFQGGVLALIGIEFLSMLENLSLLEECGGVDMGPAKPILRRIAHYLAITQKEHGTHVVATMTYDEKKTPTEDGCQDTTIETSVEKTEK